ncbi:MAG: hypothetical protein GF311_02885 [Candidatus Lokiarchaeota archaeon]|nr:hypothetical protein [Candidatus Lokiarchaeota archaeon]
MRVLYTKEEEIQKAEERERKHREKLDAKQKTAVFLGIAGLVFCGIVIGSPYLGSMFSPYTDDEFTTGWADLTVYYMGLNQELHEFAGECCIDLYYLENATIYAQGLSLGEFPYHVSHPTSFLFNDTTDEFAFYYGMLLGNPDQDEPYANQILLRREVAQSNLEVSSNVYNFTYTNYSEPDLLDPTISEFLLDYNSSSSEALPFGTYSPRLCINITNLPFGYSWGVSSVIPPDLFEESKLKKEIAYRNGFNWKGMMLGFDAEVNASLLMYGAENYHFFEDLQIYTINLTSTQEPEQLWITRLPTVDHETELIVEFNTVQEISVIYLWSGWLDEYASQYIYNNYTLLKVN